MSSRKFTDSEETFTPHSLLLCGMVIQVLGSTEREILFLQDGDSMQ